MPGNGYFTRILSDVVGPNGRVYAFNPQEQINNCAPSEIAGSLAIAHDPSYTNVTVLAGSLANFRIPEKLDLLWRLKITTICTMPFWDLSTSLRSTGRFSTH
jgi:predicted methyltransferase